MTKALGSTKQLKRKKKENRTAFISLRVLPKEKEALKRKAAAAHQSLTTYVMDQVNKELTSVSGDLRELQNICRLLYRAREQLNTQTGISPDVESAIKQTIAYFQNEVKPL